MGAYRDNKDSRTRRYDDCCNPRNLVIQDVPVGTDYDNAKDNLSGSFPPTKG
jgi:hypothetical protein